MGYEELKIIPLIWVDNCISCEKETIIVQADNVLGSSQKFCLECIANSIHEFIKESEKLAHSAEQTINTSNS